MSWKRCLIVLWVLTSSILVAGCYFEEIAAARQTPSEFELRIINDLEEPVLIDVYSLEEIKCIDLRFSITVKDGSPGLLLPGAQRGYGEFRIPPRTLLGLGESRWSENLDKDEGLAVVLYRPERRLNAEEVEYRPSGGLRLTFRDLTRMSFRVSISKETIARYRYGKQ